MDSDIYCNYTQCRERLNSKCYVTSCSHAFCLRHGNKVFSVELICPACKTSLNNSKYDIMHADANPPEDFRSMILAGLRPEIVIEIAQRAIGFWNYQIHMENTYNVNKYSQCLNALSQMEQKYQADTNNYEIKLKHAQQKVQDLEKQLQQRTKLLEEVKEKFSEKMREHSTMLQKYTAIKRHYVHDEAHTPNYDDINISKNSTDFKIQERIPDVLPRSALKTNKGFNFMPSQSAKKEGSMKIIKSITHNFAFNPAIQEKPLLELPFKKTE